MSEQAEILQNELKLNSDEIKLRQQVCNSLTKSLQTFFPGSKMIIFGSSVYLTIPVSDLHIFNYYFIG